MSKVTKVWNGSAWVELVGATGPTGPQGTTGATGPTGPTGTTPPGLFYLYLYQNYS